MVGICPGGIWHGGLLSGWYLSGGICPGGICPGGICPRTINLYVATSIYSTMKYCLSLVVRIHHQRTKPYQMRMIWQSHFS